MVFPKKKRYLLQEANFTFIEIVGLMTMAPITNSDIELHHVFHELKQLQQEIHALQLKNIPCTELSMGMTNDYGIAITEGATFIRVGRALVNDDNMECNKWDYRINLSHSFS